MELKDRLRELRGNMTQTSCAISLGVSTANYNKWENGVQPNLTVLCHIADYYNVTLDYLVGRTDVKDIQYKSINDELGFNDTSIHAIKKLRTESPEEFEALEFLLEKDLEPRKPEDVFRDDEYFVYYSIPGFPYHNPDLQYIDDFMHYEILGLRTLLKYFTFDPDGFDSYFRASRSNMLVNMQSFTKSKAAEYYLTKIINFNKFDFWQSLTFPDKNQKNTPKPEQLSL